MDTYLMNQGAALGVAPVAGQGSSKFLHQESKPSAPQHMSKTAALQLSAADQLTVQRALRTARTIAEQRGLSTTEYTPGYTSQSGEILGMLKQMYDNLKEIELPDLQAIEKKEVDEFIVMRKSLMDQIYSVTERLHEKEDELSQ